MRPPKLRLPDGTAAAPSCPSAMALATFCGSGPELPMQWCTPTVPALQQLRRRAVSRRRERPGQMLAMPGRDSLGHPHALFVDPVHGAPVDRGGAGPERLVDTVAVPDPLHEREPIREPQTHFDTWFA